MSYDDLKIGAIIGRGSYADVHLGTYCGSQVAIKKCRLPVSDEYSKYRNNCIREASLLKRLYHEKILHYIDIFEESMTKTMCILLEYINGGTMERFCQQNSVTLQDTNKYEIAYFCWKGLAYLHEKHICHKDIKPENILISQDLKIVKIADFGFAELKHMSTIYTTKTLKGTSMYVPPELLATDGFTRHPQKSDVYSMGATLCEFFSGLPFWSNDNQPISSNAVLSKMHSQWAAVQSRMEPMEPSCWKGINIEIQKILICAINADYTKRKTANQMLELFKDLYYNKFEPYFDNDSSRWRKELEERHSETPENIAHYEQIELNHARNEETRKKKENGEKHRELMTSERPKQLHSSTIQIRNVSLLSEETLHLYFKHELQSHGGKIANIIFEKAYDRAIIDFDNADIAERALNKNDYSLEGQRLYVSNLPPQCENRFYFDNIPKFITLNLLKKHLEAISQTSIEDIRFGKENESAIICFQNEVSDLQNKLNKRPFKDDNDKKISDVKIHPIVHPDAVLICGTFPNVDHLIYLIEDFLSNFKDKVSPNIRSVFAKEESNMVLVIFEDYRAVSFLKDSLTIDDNIFSISPFFDHLGWVPQDHKKNVLRECPSSIVTEKLSPLQIEFLSKPVAINFLQAEVDKLQWNCVFEITEEKVLAVTSETKAISEQIIKYILGRMTSIDIKLDDAMMKYWSEKGSDLQYLVSDKNIQKWFCYSQNKSFLTILAASSKIGVIKQDVERFFSDNIVYEATIVESEMLGKYLKRFYTNYLKLFCQRNCNGHIPFKFNSNGVMVASGLKHQIQMLIVHVNYLLSDVQIFQYIIKTPEMASHFQSHAGFAKISMIADKSETIIDIVSNNKAQINDGVKIEAFSDRPAIPKSVVARSFDLAVLSTINQYERAVGKLSAVHERAIEQSITLCICGPSQNVQLASKMLNDTCDEKCQELIVSNDIIGTFDPITINKLHEQAMTFSVEIKVLQEQCKVKINGYQAFDFQNFLTDVLDKMKDELTEDKAKWYKRKGTSSSWVQMEVDVFQLEKEYKNSGGQGCIQFESENDGLVTIDFDKMVILSVAKNILYNLKRLDSSNIPSEWGWDDKCLIDYKLVELQSNSLEYSTVSKAVSQTANVIIEKIERVENLCKYQQYIALKLKMEKSLSAVRGCIAEKYLFHGTAAGNISDICTYGFNRTLSGQNGVLYGHGSYFARDFSYSARPTNGATTVFYARVLTGNYTKGTTDMKVAPYIDASKNLKFDSVVDDVKNPSIYVIFSDNHAYPAYVITYKLNSQSSKNMNKLV